MTQPLDLDELARETSEKALRLIRESSDPIDDILTGCILSALTKLVAVKDAEKQRFVNRLAKALDDLAGHKAALKIATDALTNAERVFLGYVVLHMAKTPPDVLKASSNKSTADQIADALQQIKELKP